MEFLYYFEVTVKFTRFSVAAIRAFQNSKDSIIELKITLTSLIPAELQNKKLRNQFTQQR